MKLRAVKVEYRPELTHDNGVDFKYSVFVHDDDMSIDHIVYVTYFIHKNEHPKRLIKTAIRRAKKEIKRYYRHAPMSYQIVDTGHRVKVL